MAALIASLIIGVLASVTLASALTKGANAEPEYIEALRGMANGDQFQLEALADGFVTPEEWNGSFELYLQCASDAGFTIHEIDPGNGLRRTTVALATPGDFEQEEIRAAHAKLGSCASENLDAVDSAFALQVPVPDDAEAAVLIDRLMACVNEGGVPGVEASDQVYSGDRRVEIDRVAQTAYAQCARVVQEKTGMLSPMPVLR